MIEWVVERLSALIPTIDKLSVSNRELKDNALRSISHALNETYLYYGALEKDGQRDREVEKQLSRYWAAAAIPLRHVDQELASVCEYKSDYWVNPDSWDQEKVDRLGIGLKKVRNQYRALLVPKVFSLKGRKK
jgi:hypothetical protein